MKSRELFAELAELDNDNECRPPSVDGSRRREPSLTFLLVLVALLLDDGAHYEHGAHEIMLDAMCFSHDHEHMASSMSNALLCLAC